jgi:hypothetical protein
MSDGSEVVSRESGIDGQKSEVRFGSYQSTVLNYIVKLRYQATTGEDEEDLVPAVEICRVYRLMRVL